MADVSGTEVLYTRENRHGVTTLTFRKRRYMLPEVVIKGDDVKSLSLGNLQSSGSCVMLDVGMYCPHCTGPVSASLSGTHSKLMITKQGPEETSMNNHHHHVASSSADSPKVTASRSDENVSKHARIKKIKTGSRKGNAEETQVKMVVNSCKQNSGNPTAIPAGLCGKCEEDSKEASSDYESLDRDKPAHFRSSDPNFSNTNDLSKPRFSFEASINQQHRNSSRPSQPSLSSTYSKELDSVFEAADESRIPQQSWAMQYQNIIGDKSQDDEGTSDRSASPELLVDDVLESVKGEIYSVDATLPRVFALKKDSKVNSHKRTKHTKVSASQKKSSNRQPDFKGYRTNSADHIHAKKKGQHAKNRTDFDTHSSAGNVMKSSFSHEDFFEQIMEGLTDLESGFAPDFTSDYESDVRDLTSSTCRSGYDEDMDSHTYANSVDVYKSTNTKYPSSSCECITDDKSHYLDSSLENIMTPSEASAGDFFGDGYGSSSEGSCGHDRHTPEETALLDTLIRQTQDMTDNLNVISSEDPDFQNEQNCLREQGEHTQQTVAQMRPNNIASRNHYIDVKDGVQTKVDIPDIRHPDENEVTRLKDEPGSDSDGSSINEASSLENLLSSNALHCSTSDLDEPYATELKHAGIIGPTERPRVEKSKQNSSIEKDFEKCLETKTKEVDQFVPQVEEPVSSKSETVQQVFDAAKYVSSLLSAHHITPPETFAGAQHDQVDNSMQHTGNEKSKSSDFDSTVQSGNWTSLTSESDTKVATFETKNNMSKEQSQQFLKYVLNQSSHTKHSHNHTTDLDACLDEVCQTCELKPQNEKEIVKNEEVTTQEVTLVFAWPKKKGKKNNKALLPVTKSASSDEPFRTLHLRRVMRVTDFDIDAVESSKVESIECSKDGVTNATNEAVSLDCSTVESSASCKEKEYQSVNLESSTNGNSHDATSEDLSKSNGSVDIPELRDLGRVLETIEEDACLKSDASAVQSESLVCFGGDNDISGDASTSKHSYDNESKEYRHVGVKMLPSFIPKEDRNVKVLQLGKYFSPPSSKEGSPMRDLDTREEKSPGAESPSRLFMLQPTKYSHLCTDCSESQVNTFGGGSSSNLYVKKGHPYPCQRCIHLEREIRQKLSELSAIADDLGSKGVSKNSIRQCFSEENVSHSTAYHQATGPLHQLDGDVQAVKEKQLWHSFQHMSSSTTFSSDLSNVLSFTTSPRQELEQYADNLSKYILFRAKLFIVLRNTKTIPDCVSRLIQKHIEPEISPGPQFSEAPSQDANRR